MRMKTIKKKIGVIGASKPSLDGLEKAYAIGSLIAQKGAILVCGGLGGIMEAASRGAYEAGGEILGILPGADSSLANPYVTIPVSTNMGHARNIIIAHTSDLLIALEGEFGTLSEMAIGLKLGKAVIALPGALELPETIQATTPEHAIEIACEKLKI